MGLIEQTFQAWMAYDYGYRGSRFETAGRCFALERFGPRGVHQSLRS
jgi:hypothetical protein